MNDKTKQNRKMWRDVVKILECKRGVIILEIKYLANKAKPIDVVVATIAWSWTLPCTLLLSQLQP